MTETTGVPFTPTLVRGFVERIDAVHPDGRYMQITGSSRWLWMAVQYDRLRVGDDVTVEMDGEHIIGVLLRLV